MIRLFANANEIVRLPLNVHFGHLTWCWKRFTRFSRECSDCARKKWWRDKTLW